MTIYPLTERDERRVRECAAALIARIPESERWLMLAGADRFGLTTGIEIDLFDPTDVSVMWPGRTIFTVPRQALAGSGSLDDHIESLLPQHPVDVVASHRCARQLCFDLGAQPLPTGEAPGRSFARMVEIPACTSP